jgi:hypothetical protein
MTVPLQSVAVPVFSSKGSSSSSSPPSLQLLHKDVTFTSTQVGKVTQVKVELKNSLDYNVDLTVQPPQSPFSIRHKAFKITYVVS